MANTLLIQKETGGYFGFTLTVNGITQEKIRNMRNDALGVGNIVHFKTANGANIVKVQDIDIYNITLIASGTFTFTNIDTFFAKLIDVGYWDWVLGGGTGTGADRFDELLDTFNYFGKDGQAVRVNESQLKLETFTVYNYRTFTALEDTFDVIVPNKMLVTNNAGNKVELADLPTPPEQFLNSVGYFKYFDLASQTTPIPFVANIDKLITNDGLGSLTDTSQPPYGVSNVLASGNLDFSQLSIGDSVDIRIDGEITTTSANQQIKIYFKVASGTASEELIYIYPEFIKAAGANIGSIATFIEIRNSDVKTAPTELYIVSDSGGSIKITSYLVRVLRKNINIIELSSDLGYTAENIINKASNFTIINNTLYPTTQAVQNYVTANALTTLITSVTDITSSALSSQTSAGMATWINANSFSVATNEIRQFHVTDTGQVFKLLLRGRSFGSATPAISYIDVLDYGYGGISLSANNIWTGIQTFLNAKLGLRNIADTFTSYFSNANTASRTYTLQNKTGTVAHLDDIAVVGLDEGNGIGYVIGGRVAANYGNIGLGAVDLGYSDSASSTRGATGARAVVSGGIRNTASNTLATVGGGADNTASGQFSTVGGGYLNTASGSLSTVAGGDGNVASGNYSNVAGGSGNVASGNYSNVAGGENNRARSYGEWVGGVFGTDYTPISTTTWQALDRIFNIGNGTASVRSDAFTILKNGLATLPSVTNALITAEATGKAVVTKEYISNVQRNIIKDVTVSSTITGVIEDTEAKSYLIPATSFSANDIMTMYVEFNKIGTVNTATYKIWKNTTNSFAGATQVAIFNTTAANLTTKMGRNFTLRGGNMMGNNATSSIVMDLSSNSNFITTTAFDTTIDNYIFVSIALAGATDTAIVSSVKITN